MDESAKFCEHGVNVEFGCPTCRVADYPRLQQELTALQQELAERKEQVMALTEKLEAPGIIDVKHIERIRALETALEDYCRRDPLIFYKTDRDKMLALLGKPVEESGKEPSRGL